jgi:hypothetical protein
MIVALSDEQALRSMTALTIENTQRVVGVDNTVNERGRQQWTMEASLLT